MMQNGISLNRARDCLVQDNDLEDVHGSAIAIVDESSGTVKGNKLRRVTGNALYISGYSDVLLEGNVVETGKYPGIAILMGSTAVLRQNTIKTVECSGICVRGARAVEISELTVIGAHECGISVSDSPSVSITASTFEGCDVAGIECYNRAVVTFRESRISGCPVGFLVYTEAQLTAEGNTAVDLRLHLARIVFRGSVRITGTQCSHVAALADFQTVNTCVFQGNGDFPDWTNSPSEAALLAMELVPPWTEALPGMCLKCRSRPRNAFLMDCGHRPYCLACANAAKDAKETCPVCRFPIARATVGFEASDGDVCLICWDTPPTCVTVPCGHRGFCKACLEQWYKNHRSCPTCRTDPSSFKEIIADL
jgi:hypothetical protein